MQSYMYLGPYERVYPDILDPPHGSLVAVPGDVREFDEPPDARWVPAPAELPAIKLPAAEKGQE